MENAIGGITDISIDFTLSFKPLNNCCFNTQLDECIQKKNENKKNKNQLHKTADNHSFLLKTLIRISSFRDSPLHGSQTYQLRTISYKWATVRWRPPPPSKWNPISPYPQVLLMVFIKKNALRSGEDSTGGHTLLISPHSHSLIQAQSRL